MRNLCSVVTITLSILTIALLIGRSRVQQATVQTTVVTVATNSYEEIGWRKVISKGEDTETKCSYIIVSTNDTSHSGTFVSCWVGGGGISVEAVLREHDGVKQAYILKSNTGISPYPTFVVKWNAKYTCDK